MQVKICGLTRPLDALFAEEAQADFIGVILASGPRLLNAEQAAHVLGPKRHSVRRAAVFGMQKPTVIADLARLLDVDVAQLHGDPTPADIESILGAVNCAVWPVIRVEGTALPASAFELARAAGALVLDAKVTGQLGGTGTALDWRGLAENVDALRSRLPETTIVLAGGLNPQNVEHAIGLLAPDVVDVSSGVETAPGIKDADAITAFVRAAKHAGRGVR